RQPHLTPSRAPAVLALRQAPPPAGAAAEAQAATRAGRPIPAQTSRGAGSHLRACVGSLCGVTVLGCMTKRTHHTFIRSFIALLFLAVFGLAAAQRAAGTTSVSLMAARPNASFALEWRDPATGAPVTHWDFGVTEAGVTETLDL